ncbi:hypothetical protein [Pseudomonas sp.]|uniref:hypothetical protein n=1 Tax=Pseudomonas sp. TaxID=306 RepID=UPI0028AF8154|nr:hypothetical protein [Pseudomonas sp.]
MEGVSASVVGGSLVSFLPGITEQQRDAVQLAVLLSERITRRDHADGLVDDWYSYYRRRLQYLGWDALASEQVHWPKPQRKAITDKALESVGKVAGEQHARSLAVALPKLMSTEMPLRHMEQRTRELGLFQLVPCAPSKQGYVDVVIYHEAGNRASFSAGFLSSTLEKTQVRAELVRFNVRLFQQEFEAKVRRNLESVMRQEIFALDL